MNRYFYHEITRKMVILFGNIFNNIKIRKTSEDGDKSTEIIVPIFYAQTQKFLKRDESTDENNYISQRSFPLMSYQISNINYDTDRKTISVKRIYKELEDGTRSQQFVPVPYTIEFELNILSKYSTDCLQVLEQIVPLFQPGLSFAINIIPEIKEKRNIGVVLNGIQLEDNFESGLNSIRLVNYRLSFTMKTYYYGITDVSTLIEQVIVKTYADLNQEREPDEIIYIPELEDEG